MSIEVLADVIVPKRVILAGVNGRATRQNARTVNQGGFATVNVVRDVTLREYTIGVKSMLLERWQEIMAIYEITDAGAFGMLIEDPTDAVVTQANSGLLGFQNGVPLGVPGFGNGGPTYLLQRLFRAAGSSRVRGRDVTRLKGTPALFRNGVPVVLGAGAGNASVSAGPSTVTFVPDATRTVTAVTPGASTQVTLATAIPGLIVGGLLWLQGLGGANASLLNGRAHVVTAIAGSVYTLSTNTAGATITASGEGRFYPQPNETLTWAGGYYVPVQFVDDAIEWDLMRPGDYDDRLVAGPAIALREVREA